MKTAICFNLDDNQPGDLEKEGRYVNVLRLPNQFHVSGVGINYWTTIRKRGRAKEGFVIEAFRRMEILGLVKEGVDVFMKKWREERVRKAT